MMLTKALHLCRRAAPRFVRLHSTSLPPPRLDYRGIAENVVYKSHNAFNRKAPIPVGTVQTVERLYKESREVEAKLNDSRAQHNAMIKRVKEAEMRDRAALIEDARVLKEAVHTLEVRAKELEAQLYAHAALVPNDTHPDVPIGAEAAATVLSTHGPPPLVADPARDHMRIVREFGLANFDAGAAATGSSWYYLTGAGAQLELAITNYAVDVALRHGFSFVTTPDVIKADVAARCGFLPRDDANPPVHHMYHLQGTDLVLSGTAEIPLAAMYAGRVMDYDALPAKVVGLGRAFRSEAGARGADTRGLYRVHQFSKLELFAVTRPAQSNAILEELLHIQTEIFSGLGLSFRVLDMPTEELGASAYRKYDIEAWMPGRGKWGEISSASNCTDYQSRRLHIRHTVPITQASPSSQIQRPGTHPFAHTLNGTATAIPRLIIALIENGAEIDPDTGAAKRINLPSTLLPHWIGGAQNVPSFMSWR